MISTTIFFFIITAMPNILSQFQLLELNVISAQDLAKVARKMRTYAVAWVHPGRKLSTRIDTDGHNNPTWNDKFVFRVDENFLYSDTSAVMIEIYALHWFRDVHVGTVRVIVGNLIPPPRPNHHNQFHLGMRFAALQVRRPSGRPQGILNIGAALLESTMRSMPLYKQPGISAVGYDDLMGHGADHLDNYPSKDDEKTSSDNSTNQLLVPWIPKPELRRTKSQSSSMVGGSQMMMPQRNFKMEMKDNAGNSIICGSEAQKKNKKNKIGRSKAISMISGSEPGKRKNRKKQWRLKASSRISGSKAVDKHRKGNSAVSDSELNGSLKRAKYWSEVESSDVASKKTTEEKSDSKLLEQSDFLKRPSKWWEFASPYNLFGSESWKKPSFMSTPKITDSELGPSASEVAAIVARNKHFRTEETESEITGTKSGSVEGLQSKLERWRIELPPLYNVRDFSGFLSCSNPSGVGKVSSNRRHGRRHTDDDARFSCFSSICGLECTMACGGPFSRKGSSRRVERSCSMDYLDYV